VLLDNNLVKLVVQIFIGVVTYIGLSKIAKIEKLNTVYDLFGSVLKKGKISGNTPVS